MTIPFSFGNFRDGALPAVDDDGVPVLEGGCGAHRSDHAGQPVLAGDHGAVRYESPELRHDAAQEREVGAPADVRAYGDQDVPLENYDIFALDDFKWSIAYKLREVAITYVCIWTWD